MKLSAILAPMIAAGVSGEIILDTVRAYEEEADAMSEQGKEKARERWRRWKNKQGTNVCKRLQTDTNVSKPLTRVEDSSSNQEISGQEKKKDTSPSARSSRGSRIPDDFQPDIDAAIRDGLSRQEAERQALNFCDYWRAKPGAGALKVDWPAAWRTWFRRRVDERPRSTAPPAGAPKQDFNTILDAMQGKPNAPLHTGPTIEASFERRDRSGTADVVQLHAISARG